MSPPSSSWCLRGGPPVTPGPGPRTRSTLVLLSCLLLGLGCGAEPAPSAPRPPRPLPGTPLVEEIDPGAVLVELQPDIVPFVSTLQAAPLQLGGIEVTVERPIFEARPPSGSADAGAGPIYLVRTAARDEAGTRRDVRAITADPRVRRAEPDHIRRAAAGPPNDPLFEHQWGLARIHVPEAWAISSGSTDTIVAVLDTGIAMTPSSPIDPPPRPHPDLQGRLLPGYDFITRVASSGDEDGRDPDPTDPGDVFNSRLHGTHVAGILGANTDNRMGIAGVNPRCRILPVRVLGIRSGDGVDSDIADAVIWSSGGTVRGVPPLPRPADILNMSFGGPGVSFTLQRAITEALGRGVIIVAAAGNGGADATTFSPGALDGVITVGAQDRPGVRAEYSNYGPRVDLLAPGGGFSFLEEDSDLGSSLPDGILGTYRDDGDPEPALAPFTYAQLIGTSQAAPHVAGAAALVKAVFPAVRQESLLALLRYTASPSGQELCQRDLNGGCGAGLIDAEALMKLAAEQPRCGCPNDWVCLTPTSPCVAPIQVHPSLFERPVIRGGWCSMAPRSGPDPRGWLVLLALGALLRLGRSRRRARAIAQLPSPRLVPSPPLA